jgi:hypothetical protein
MNIKLKILLTTHLASLALSITAPSPSSQYLSIANRQRWPNTAADELNAYFNTSARAGPSFDGEDLASELWNKAKCRGERFVAAMMGTDEEAGKAFASEKTPPTMRSEWQGDMTGKVFLPLSSPLLKLLTLNRRLKDLALASRPSGQVRLQL